jgi:hypothetical protein
MPRRLQPPSPVGQDIKVWASQLVGYLRDNAGDDDETTPKIALLAHQIPARPASAKTPGAMMYDPTIPAPVVANGVEWAQVVTTTTPLPANTNCVIVSATTYTPALIPDATLRTLALAVQEVILRLDSLERR